MSVQEDKLWMKQQAAYHSVSALGSSMGTLTGISGMPPGIPPMPSMFVVVIN